MAGRAIPGYIAGCGPRLRGGAPRPECRWSGPIRVDSPERWAWDSNTCSHNTVIVNARKQLNRDPAYLTMFTTTPTAQALEVSGEVAYRGIVCKYKRTLVWVDVDRKNSYLVDIFRAVGRAQHDYSLHGASADVTIAGVNLSRQSGGTLAGPDV